MGVISINVYWGFSMKQTIKLWRVSLQSSSSQDRQKLRDILEDAGLTFLWQSQSSIAMAKWLWYLKNVGKT